jgi:hypothetical protein
VIFHPEILENCDDAVKVGFPLTVLRELTVSTRLKNRIAKIEADRGLGSQPIIVVVNFGSDCEDDWDKAQEDAITEYKEINGDVDVRDAKFTKLCFI